MNALALSLVLLLSPFAQAGDYRCPPDMKLGHQYISNQIQTSCDLSDSRVREATEGVKVYAEHVCGKAKRKCLRSGPVLHHYYTADCRGCPSGWSPVCRIYTDVLWCEPRNPTADDVEVLDN